MGFNNHVISRSTFVVGYYFISWPLGSFPLGISETVTLLAFEKNSLFRHDNRLDSVKTTTFEERLANSDKNEQ